jgi:reverse gyrase
MIKKLCIICGEPIDDTRYADFHPECEQLAKLHTSVNASKLNNIYREERKQNKTRKNRRGTDE